MDDETPPVSDAERKQEEEQAGAPDCASVEESRRAEDELELYLLNGNDGGFLLQLWDARGRPPRLPQVQRGVMPSEGECDAASVEERERTMYEREKSSGAFSSSTTERSTVRARRE